MLIKKLSELVSGQSQTLRTLAGKPQIGQDQNAFMNKYTKWFFRQLDMGFASPFIASVGVLAGSAGMYFWCAKYVVPTVNEKVAKIPALRVPLKDSHNVFWGLHTTSGLTRQAELQEYSKPEEVFRQPSIIHSEISEQYPGYELVVMDMGEYDPEFNDDVHYRSAFYVSRKPSEGELTEIRDQKSNKWAKDSDEVNKSTNAPISEPIHAIVKCRSITDTNNCMQFAGQIEEELTRKMLLTLGPHTVTRDPTYSSSTHHHRITEVYDDPANALVVGLRSGSFARFLTGSMGNFKVDYVEGDASLVRIARRFLGHKESDAIKTIVTSPFEYLQHVAVGRIEKKYDIVLVDAIGPDGMLNKQYCRLDCITSMKNALFENGVLGVILPNSDIRFMKSAIDNFRLAFDNSSGLLIHAETVPYSIFILARDDGKPYIAALQDISESHFKSLLNTVSFTKGNQLIRVDLTNEVTNFKCFPVGKAVDDVRAYAPANHPFVLAALSSKTDITSSLRGGKPESFLEGLAKKMKFWSGSAMSPTMKADYGTDK